MSLTRNETKPQNPELPSQNPASLFAQTPGESTTPKKTVAELIRDAKEAKIHTDREIAFGRFINL